MLTSAPAATFSHERRTGLDFLSEPIMRCRSLRGRIITEDKQSETPIGWTLCAQKSCFKSRRFSPSLPEDVVKLWIQFVELDEPGIVKPWHATPLFVIRVLR